jgi:cytochrome c
MSRTTMLAIGAIALLSIGTAGAVVAERRQRAADARASALTGGGDPARGHGLIRRYGCGSCHTIPGVPGAGGLVGPPLAEVGRRAYVGGVLTNTPEHLMRWIVDAPGVDPLTAMPKTGVTADEARHIASYLYALR